MNYFGLFFTFFLPGVVIGLITGFAIVEKLENSKR